jgi:tetratricopeptide (TPR) repeat protein
MKSPRLPWLVMLLLLTIIFSLAPMLELRPQHRPVPGRGSERFMEGVMGESRRMLANSFFVKADAYFHSGFYPTIYDNQESFKTAHMAEDAGAVGSHNAGDETAFMGKPRDIIEKFSRNFLPATHTHLDEGGAQGKTGDLGEDSQGSVREILPWLKLSADLDPHRIETYTVTAYWLRNRMGKVGEAEQFLRDGLDANPGSYAILYELGRIYAENRTNTFRARNLWEAALKKWQEQEPAKKEPDNFLLEQISTHLAVLEEKEGNYDKAIAWFETSKKASQTPAALQERIDELRKKSSVPAVAPPSPK